MLNELMVANKGLKSLNIEFKRSHAKIKPLPKGMALRLNIDPKNQKISGVEIEEDATQLIRYVPNNFSQFPYANISKLFLFDNVEKYGLKSQNKFDKKIFFKSKHEILNYMRTFPKVWNDKEEDRIERIHKLADNVKELFDENLLMGEATINSLLIPSNFFSKYTPEKMLKLFQNIAIDFVEKSTDHDELDKYRRLFFRKNPSETFPLLLEPIHPNTLLRSRQAQDALIDIAETFDKKSTKSHKRKFEVDKKDAFANSLEGYDEKTLPKVKLPFLGDVILRSQNDDIPCNNRYGEFKSDGFPVGKETREAVRQTLDWLIQANHEGTIWTKINYQGDKQPQILVIYPESFQEDEQKESAKIIIGFMSENVARKNSYEKSARDLIEGIHKLRKSNRGSASVRLLTFRKMDKSRAGIDISIQMTFESIQQAVQSWINACKNLPEMHIAGLSGDAIRAYPVLHLYDQLNTIWKKDRGDIRAEKTPRFKLRQALALQFGLSSQSDLKYMLRALTNNTFRLFEYLARRSFDYRHGKAKDTKTSIDHMMSARKVLHLMAALLWYLNIKKEEYVNDPCFLLGRLLAASDWLHELYSVHVREGDFPPQFLGSAQLQLAYNSPRRAIAQLSVRLKPYLAWAKRSKSIDDKIGMAFGMLQNIMTQLEVHALPERTNEIQKALILKGFLAKSTAKSKSEGDNDE